MKIEIKKKNSLHFYFLCVMYNNNYVIKIVYSYKVVVMAGVVLNCMF